MKNLLAASLLLLTLGGCGTANGLVPVPQSPGSQAAFAAAGKTAAARCSGIQLYGSFGTFTIVSLQGPGNRAAERGVVALLKATADSSVKGSFKGQLMLEGLSASQLTPGTVIKAFVNYTCVANNTILAQAQPYSVGEIQIVSGHK